MKRKRRRVAVVTGTRAEYGLLCSTMHAIQRHPRLQLQLVVTGMHLLERFGYTIDSIKGDGWHIDATVRMQQGLDSRLDQANGFARGVVGMSRYFDDAGTDIVVVLGDRIEAAAGAMAAVTTGRILAHIHGGDVAIGDVDEGLRHCITKLAHIHFPATAQAARRIIRMGERRENVFNVGAPGIDRLIEVVCDEKRPPTKSTNMALVVQHPSGRSAAREARTMSAILRAVRDAELVPTIIYPNSDPGHTGIIDAIKRSQTRGASPIRARQEAGRSFSPVPHGRGSDEPVGRSAGRIHRSVARDDYLRLLAEARILIGNSSSGIIEAGSAGTPAVNVGDRQSGRQRSGPSVVDVGESYAQIREGIGCALSKRPGRGGRTCYGDGHTGQRIADILACITIDDKLRRKQITY